MQTLFYYKSYVNIAHLIGRANDGETKTNFWLRFTRMGDGGAYQYILSTQNHMILNIVLVIFETKKIYCRYSCHFIS